MKLLHNAKIISTLIFLLTGISAFAQEYQWAFKVGGRSNNSGHIVKHNGNNELIVAGSYYPGADYDPSSTYKTLPGSGVFIAKYTTNQQLLWVKGITEVNLAVWTKDMDIDASGNTIVTGNMSGVADFDPSASGTVYLYDGSGVDAYIAKYDTGGNYLWAFSLQGPGGQQVNTIATDADNNFYISGWFLDTVDFDPSPASANLYSDREAIFIAKYDSNGKYLWAKYLPSLTNDTYWPNVNNIQVAGNHFYLTGVIHNATDFDPSAGTAAKVPGTMYNSFIAKYDTSGAYQWANLFNNAANPNPGGGAQLTLDAQGNIIFAALYTAVTDFDPSANTHNFTLTGTGSDIALVKYNSSGKFIWGKSIGGSGVESPKYLITGTNDDIYMTGVFRSEKMDFDPSADSAFLYPYNDADDVFLAKYDSSGGFKWARSLPGQNYEGSSGLALDNNNDVYLLGFFGDTTDFNPGTGENILVPQAGSANIFLAKYAECTPQVVSKQDSVCDGSSYTFGGMTLTTPGAYRQKFVTVNGCDSIVNLTLKVLPLPNVVITATDDTLCLGDSVTLTASGASTYFWSNGITNGVRFAPASTQNYMVRGTSASGCHKNVYQLIVVNPVPSTTVSVTDNSKCSGTCDGQAVVNASAGTPPYTYAWDANAGGQTTAIGTNLCAGNYTVTVSDKNSCQAIKKVLVKAMSNSDVQVYLTNLAAVDQVNVSPAFSAYYTYNLPASITPPPSNPRNFVDPGKKARFKVECTNNKSDGQSIVSGISKVRSNSPYITITDTTSALNNVGWNNKAWSADEFEIDIEPGTPAGTNAYIDFIVQENGKEYATTCIAVPIHPLKYSPSTPATVDDDNNPDSQGNDDGICDPDETIEFYPLLDNVSTMDAEYVRGRFENLDNHGFVTIWNNVPGVNTTVYDATWWNYAFAEPQTITASAANTTPEYDFVFDYTNTNTGNFKLYLVMAGGFKLFSGNALSLVQWSLPYTFATTGSSTGVEEVKSNTMLVYPNPASGTVVIKSTGTGNAYTYTVLNATGQAVLQGQLTGEYTQVDISTLAEGIYLVKLNGNTAQTFKIIKR